MNSFLFLSKQAVTLLAKRGWCRAKPRTAVHTGSHESVCVRTSKAFHGIAGTKIVFISLLRPAAPQVKINGDTIGTFDSLSGSTMISLGIQEDGVHTVTLESVGIGKLEWISLLEVGRAVGPRNGSSKLRGTLVPQTMASFVYRHAL